MPQNVCKITLFFKFPSSVKDKKVIWQVFVLSSEYINFDSKCKTNYLAITSYILILVTALIFVDPSTFISRFVEGFYDYLVT